MINALSGSPLCTLLIGEFSIADKEILESLFLHAAWRLLEARSRGDALQCLRDDSVHVVLAQNDVPGWPWKDILSDLGSFRKPPQLIVASRYADDSLWSEVLNFGAYDVLQQPLNPNEVERVLASARRHFDFQPERARWGHVRAAAS